jgi:UDP-N-acetylmuramyl pentapeptide phosphotransferase/UDP-N-acetylglucosamine-1-phosphate transferase
MGPFAQVSWGVFCAVLALAGVACAALIVALRPLLVRYALARPNARSSHKEPTPQGGGIAVLAAALAAAWAGAALGGMLAAGETMALAMLSAAAVLLALLGAADDIRPMGAAPRLALHFVAVGIVVAMLPADFSIVPYIPPVIERALLIVGGVYVVNLVNFMDGLDLMTVAEVVPVTVGVLLIGLAAPLPLSATLVAIALLGATLGFAPFNRPVARLFLGDVGSLPIGLLLGWLMLMLAGQGYYAAALLLPLYYLADATITLVRRIAMREPFWEAHRSHFYQRATAGGFTVPEVIARVFMLNAWLVVLALVSVLEPGHLIDIPAFLLGAAFVGWTLLTFARGKR